MKNYLQLITVAAGAVIMLSSCEAIGAIFKAGVWTGLFLVALVIVIIFFIARAFRKK